MLGDGSVSAAFDTLKFVERLEAGGFSPSQARAAAGAFADATGERLSTKADVAAVSADVRQAELRLEAKIEATKVEIPKWMFGQTLLIIRGPMALLRIGH